MVESRGMGTLVRDARLRLGMTQKDLAARLGIEAAYLSQIETGARKWPQELVAPLAKALGLSQVEMAIAAELIQREGPAPPPAPDDPIELFAADLRAADLTPQELGILRGVLESMVKARPLRSGRTADPAPGRP